jgi:AsmA protein
VAVKYWKLVVGLLVVVLAAVSALPFLVDADRFRPRLERALSDTLGREVTIGKLSLSLLHGQVRADRIAIADDPAFGTKPFLAAEGLRIGVQWMPLLRQKRLVVDTLELARPQVTLLQDRQMRWNYSSIGSGAKPASAAPEAPAGSSGMDLTVKRLALTGGCLLLKAAGGPSQGVTVTDVAVDVRDISMTSVMPVTASGTLAPAGQFRLEGKVGPINKTDAALTPVDARLVVRNVDLARAGLVPSSLAMQGLASGTGTLVSKDGTASATVQTTVDGLAVGVNAKPSPVPVSLTIHLTHNLSTHRGTMKADELRAGKASARFGGAYQLKPEGAALGMSLAGNAMPVDQLVAMLPAFGVVLPQGATLQGGQLTVNATTRGSSNRLVTSGTATLGDTRLTGYSLSSVISKAASLAGIKLGSDTLIQSFRTDFETSPERTSLNGIELEVTDLGRLTGALTLDAKDNLEGRLVAAIQSSGGLAAAGLQKLGGGAETTLTIPIHLSGTASQPKLTADTRAIAKQAVAGAASKAVEKYLPGTQGQAATSLIQGLLGKKKSEEKKPEEKKPESK